MYCGICRDTHRVGECLGSPLQKKPGADASGKPNTRNYTLVWKDKNNATVTAPVMSEYWTIVRELIKSKIFSTITPVPSTKRGEYVWELKK